MNLSELTVFLAAAEAANYSEAGRQLHLSQPAVSQTIDNLERRFGTKLFARRGRTVCLTEAGQALAPLARELLAAARRLDEEMASLQGEISGEFTIGCSTTSGKYYLPCMIARFHRQYPQVKMNILMDGRAAVLEKLLAGNIPLGISSMRVEHRDLEYQDFYRDEIILIAPASHSFASTQPVLPRNLLDEPILWREEGSGTSETVLAGLQKHGISLDMLNIIMVFGSSEAVVMAVEERMGVGFCSRQAAGGFLELGRIVEVPLASLPLLRDVYLIRNRRFPLTRSQSEFWDFVRAAFIMHGSLNPGGSVP